MAKYINAAEAAEKVSTAYKIPMGDLVDVFVRLEEIKEGNNGK